MLLVDESLNLGNRATSRASTLSGSVKVTFVVLGLRASFGSSVDLSLGNVVVIGRVSHTYLLSG
jgi:hypothetical protein